MQGKNKGGKDELVAAQLLRLAAHWGSGSPMKEL
jgi:hypothetical protein